MKQISNRQSHRRSWRTTALTTAVLMALSMTSVSVNSATTRKPIGDLEIYQSASSDGAKVMMMLDMSGSMFVRSIEEDYGSSCQTSYKDQNDKKITAYVINADNTKTAITYVPTGCKVKQNGSNTLRLDRVSRLQTALIELFADEIKRGSSATIVADKASISNDYEIGLGLYGYLSERAGNIDGNNDSGIRAKIVEPVERLTPAKRIAMITKIAKLNEKEGWNTPTPQALAEAGAYFMGTNTSYDNDKLSNGSVSGSKRFSGFAESVNSAKKSNLLTYQSPITTTANQCSGNGIYLLTDGKPQATSNDIAKAVMDKSLTGSTLKLNSTCSGLSGSADTGWACTGEYSKLLRNSANPSGKTIKTATVGFGTEFAGITAKRTITVDGEPLEVVDCEGSANTADDQNALNLCRLGQRWGDDEKLDPTKQAKIYGDGGFYYVKDGGEGDDTIQKSLLEFAASLTYVIDTAPSGTITVPNDPYQASSQLAYAYLPMLDPDIASASSIWKGNLKKYALNQGTLFGKNDNKLYNNVAGDLSNVTQDLWQSGDYKVKEATVNNDIEAGGFYAQLKAPNTANIDSVRTVYVEDFKDTNDKTPVLRKLSVVAGKPIGFDTLKDTTTYTQLNKRRLLSFLGFDNTIKLGVVQSLLNIDGTLPIDAVNITNTMTLAAPTQETRVLGGVIHSKPTAISYSATLDENGRVTDDLSKRDDYVLFGSMDGALHLADSDDGKEAVAIIPRSMMINQAEALVPNSTKANVGQPYFGVDAPWLVTTDYKYDLPTESTSGKVTVDDSTGKGMFAYGGLRMGGEAFYGMNITNSTTPEVLFTITPEGLNGQASTDFTRLGQIWSKPTAARIRLTKDKDPIDVLIFGGGYDINYESDDYVATSTTPAKGNAIYIINADTGALVTSLTTSNNSAMIHSITGEITILDRDNDGLVDHLYAADLGGQVFRADFENARPKKFGFEAVNTATVKRVTRILDTTPSIDANKKFAYRFYERPVVSFYRSKGGTNNGKIFALVNVISGNRSAPLSTLRSNNDNANRVYGIIDTDVGRSDLFTAADASLGVANVKESSLVNLAATLGNTPTENIKKDTQTLLMGTASIAAKNGWYYPLTRFDGYNNVRYNKGIGDSVVINNLLYTTVYNPDKQYGTVDSCAARIAGGSERQVYCLPYGICMDPASITGTGGFIPAGQGIQELTLGAFNEDNTNLKVLIGTTTIADRILADNRNNYNTGGKVTDSSGTKVDSNIKGTSGATVAGGDGSAVEYIFNERYTLQPKAWYERQQ